MPSTKALALPAAAAAITLGLTACSSGGGGDDDTFKYGYVLPETGDLSHLSPALINSTKLARDEINDAGGVLDSKVPKIVTGDEANDAAQANDAADRLIDENVDVVLGAGATSMTLAIIDKVTGAKKVQCSGSNTSEDLTKNHDSGYFYRTAPSDLLQGPVLAQEIAADGNKSVAIAHRADDYGEGLSKAIADSLNDNGIDVEYNEGYDPNSPSFDSVVSDLEGADTDATVLVSFEEGVQIITGLVEEGVDADQMYGTDGLNDQSLGKSVKKGDPSVIEGFKGTAPAVGGSDFIKNLTDYKKGLDSFQFAGQYYDCTILSALAAEQAESTDPTVFSEEIPKVSKDGTKCDSFKKCRDLIRKGEDIDYQGTSGPIEFDDKGDVTSATFQIYGFNKKGEHNKVDDVTV